MQIFVRSIDGHLCSLEVESTTTIAEIKDHMCEEEGIDVEDQRIIFASKDLSDEITMEFAEIMEGSNLEMNLKLLGGGVASDVPDHLRELAMKYKVNKLICRKCYARLPLSAKTCRKRKCGHSSNLRPKKKIKDKEGKK